MKFNNFFFMNISRKNIFKRIFYGKCGRNSVIYKPLVIVNKRNIYLGNNVSFFCGARIECINEWENSPYEGKLIIGDNTSFEQNAHIISAGKIIIGSNCVFSARVLITNINHDYSKIDCNVLKQDLIVKDVKIGNNCFFGMDSKVFPGVSIGDNVIVGANTIVTQNVPSYSVVVGCPARVIKKYNFDKKRWEMV